jgi:hypothetical protein
MRQIGIRPSPRSRHQAFYFRGGLEILLATPLGQFVGASDIRHVAIDIAPVFCKENQSVQNKDMLVVDYAGRTAGCCSSSVTGKLIRQ